VFVSIYRKKRGRVEEINEPGTEIDGLSFLRTSNEEWLTPAKILQSVKKGKKITAKSRAALTSTKKSRKDKGKSLSLTTSLTEPVVARVRSLTEKLKISSLVFLQL
jgi:hypothetical protein